MNIHEALSTIIQQFRILSNSLDNLAFNENIEDIRKDIEEINENIETNLTNLENNIKQLVSGNNTDLSITISNLNKLGDNYSNLISLSTTFKNFIEAKDVADNTINTWKEIEEFLDGIKDNDNFLSIINTVKNDLETKIDELNVKDVDNVTIVKDNNGVIGFKGQNVNKLSTLYDSVNDNSPLGIHLINTGVISSDMYIYNASREISEEATNIVQEKALAKHLKEVNTNTTNLDDRLSVIEGKLLIIETGAKVVINVSPLVIYKNTATNVTVRGTFNSSDSALIPTKMVIKYGSNELATAENNKTVSVTESNTMTNNIKTYSIEAYVDPNNTGNPTKLTVNGNLNARNAIYAGFGTIAEEVITTVNRLSARTSANGNYTKTATANGVNYFILVPNDITVLRNFTMGGAPYVMNKSTETINGITYNVFKSGGTYNSGATVNITAS